ncbi:MAG TPA: hypothetical protein VFE14_10150 [Micromonosporaceae bacterium]|jgi:hypothetical protein|nr:hypothetical protein [Micromonosporaceae bacterium]
MSTQTKKYPTPVYAAAGAGELAYRQLRKLPGRLNELRDRVSAGDIEVKVDIERLRAAARRNARAALGEARTVYADLVARGERVVAGARTPGEESDTPALESAEAPAAAKPVKRTRPAATKR